MAFRLPGAVDRASSARPADESAADRHPREAGPIRPARGLLLGLVIGAALWALAIALVLLAIHAIAA